MATPQEASEDRKSGASFDRSAHASGKLARIFGLPSAHESSPLAASYTHWTLKLKEVSEAAAKALDVEVVSVRLIHVYEQTDRDAALFEIDSGRGKVQAILSRSGEYSFFWKR